MKSFCVVVTGLEVPLPQILGYSDSPQLQTPIMVVSILLTLLVVLVLQIDEIVSTKLQDKVESIPFNLVDPRLNKDSTIQ